MSNDRWIRWRREIIGVRSGDMSLLPVNDRLWFIYNIADDHSLPAQNQRQRRKTTSPAQNHHSRPPCRHTQSFPLLIIWCHILHPILPQGHCPLALAVAHLRCGHRHQLHYSHSADLTKRGVRLDLRWMPAGTDDHKEQAIRVRHQRGEQCAWSEVASLPRFGNQIRRSDTFLLGCRAWG